MVMPQEFVSLVLRLPQIHEQIVDGIVQGFLPVAQDLANFIQDVMLRVKSNRQLR